MEHVLYEVKKVVVGQDHFLERVMVAMLAQGHLLVEGVPGLAKTLTVKTRVSTTTLKSLNEQLHLPPDAFDIHGKLTPQLDRRRSGLDEEGVDAASGKVVVRVDPRYFRPTEVETLLGDPSKAKKELGWVPEITLDQMVQEMVAHDLSQAKQHALLKQHGYNVAVGVER